MAGEGGCAVQYHSGRDSKERCQGQEKGHDLKIMPLFDVIAGTITFRYQAVLYLRL